MKSKSYGSETGDNIAQTAAEWTLRHDRGLNATEQDEFSVWLAADRRHRDAWAEHRWGWDELDRLAGVQTSVHAEPDPDLLLVRRSRFQRYLTVALPLAAVLVLGIFLLNRGGPSVPATEVAAPGGELRSLALIEQRTLPDGSVIELNRGAIATEQFSEGERRVRLLRGEAHFTVARDPSRPFIVDAGKVAVSAVGTAFNVRLDPASVEVLVTEGIVSVATPSVRGEEPVIPSLTVNERMLVSFAPLAPPPQVTVMPPAEIEARLAWQPRLLDFTRTPLSEIVAEFNRRNPVRLVLADAGLGGLQLSATFRSDNVEGFVRLMESDFGVTVDWRADGEIVLRSTR